MLKLSLVPVVCSLAIFSGSMNACNRKSQEASIASSPQMSPSSKRITFIVGIFSRSVTVEQVRSFVKSGSESEEVASLLRAGKLDTAVVRSQLGKVYELDLIQMDKILNSQIGVALLTRLGEAIHPQSSKSAAVQAIRSAIILALADDNKLSPLEILNHLPVDMDVEVNQLLKLKDELGGAFGSAIL